MPTNIVPFVVAAAVFAVLYAGGPFYSPGLHIASQLIGEPHHDRSVDFEDEPIEATPFGEELAHLVVESGQRRFIEFFQAQQSYNQEHSHSFDLKGSIHDNLVEICGIAIDIVRDPYFQMEAREEIESKVRQTDSFMTTYMDPETDGSDKDLLDSYHDIWEQLDKIGVIDQGI